MIRQAVPADLPGVLALGLEAMNNDPYPNLVISERKCREVALQCISAPQNFCWVSEVQGEIVAAVCACVHEMTFYERRQASVVQFYSRAPGEGVKLLRKLLEWYRSRPGIKALVFTLEHGADPRIGLLLRRLGLKRVLPVYMEVG